VDGLRVQSFEDYLAIETERVDLPVFCAGTTHFDYKLKKSYELTSGRDGQHRPTLSAMESEREGR